MGKLAEAHRSLNVELWWISVRLRGMVAYSDKPFNLLGPNGDAAIHLRLPSPLPPHSHRYHRPLQILA